MKDGLTLFTIAGRLFAAPTAQIHSFARKLSPAASDADQPVIDLHQWLGAPAPANGKTLLIDLDARLIGLRVDSVIDLETEWSSVLALPALLGAVGCDPAVVGVTLVDDTPALVLDLESLARRLQSQEQIVGDGGP